MEQLIRELINEVKLKSSQAKEQEQKTQNNDLKIMFQGKREAYGEIHMLFTEKLMEVVR